MPDRNDPFIPASFVGDVPDFPIYGNDTPTMSGQVTTAEQFDPNVQRELVNGVDITDGTPNTWENEHPDQTYTAYRTKILRRTNYIPLLNRSGILKSGRTMLAGVSAWFSDGPIGTGIGATSPVYLRDGMDANAPVVMCLQPSPIVNMWFGDEGPEFKYGIYVDMSGITGAPILQVQGSLFVMKDYAQ